MKQQKRTIGLVGGLLILALFYLLCFSPTLAGLRSDWVQIDAAILTNAPLYREQGFRLGILQYGRPPDNYAGPDFPVVPMVGLMDDQFTV